MGSGQKPEKVDAGGSGNTEYINSVALGRPEASASQLWSGGMDNSPADGSVEGLYNSPSSGPAKA